MAAKSALMSTKAPSRFKQRVLVLGTGISGLSVANELLNRGEKYDVHHWSDRPVDEMTSSKAAAYWYPVCVKGDETKIAEWSRRTFYVLRTLAEGTPEAGVKMKVAREFHRTDEHTDPAWATSIPESGFRHLNKDELPDRFIDGYWLTVPVAFTQFYLRWLMHKNAARGARIETRKVNFIEEAFEDYDVVVNCTGMGSREIDGIKDAGMVPVRGQLVRIKNPGDIKEILMDEDNKDVTYLCPRSAPDSSCDDVILGGTFQEYKDSLDVDRVIASQIIERCSEFHASIKTAQVLGDVVGIRPLREKGIRVEAESIRGGKLLVHNYGHGGSGYTVADGCANDVLKLVER